MPDVILASQYRHVELPALRLLRCIYRPRLDRNEWRPLGVLIISDARPEFSSVRRAFSKGEDVQWWVE